MRGKPVKYDSARIEGLNEQSVVAITPTTGIIHQAAKSMLALSISVIPAQNKMPTVKAWNPFRQKRMEMSQVESYFNGSPEIAILGGGASGGLEIIDIDLKYDDSGTLFDDFSHLVSDADEELWNSLVMQFTRGGGVHILYRCAMVEGNKKLASRPASEAERARNPNERVKVLIETRGEGGYVIAAPSPGYRLFSGHDFAQIPTITPEQRDLLFAAARSMNRYVPEAGQAADPTMAGPAKTGFSKRESEEWEITPGDDFDARADVLELLVKHGWSIVMERGEKVWLKRPGDTTAAHSANWNVIPGRFWCWSTSTQFEAGTVYKPYAVYAWLEHNGNFKEAIKALLAAGYGKSAEPKAKPATMKVKESGSHASGLGDIHPTDFWYENVNEKNDKVTLFVDLSKLMQMLHGNGFRKYYRETDVLYLRIRGGIMEPVTQSQIRTFVGDYVASLPQSEVLPGCAKSYPSNIWQILLAKTAAYFSPATLDHLEVITPNPMRDTPTQAHFFFSNGVAKVTPDGAELVPYAKIAPYHVWDSQVKPHAIDLAAGHPESHHIADFFMRVTNGDAERRKSLMANVGYCLHRHKKGESKMVFFMDESPETTSEGGTGKGILLECVRNMRESVMFNGKMMDFKNPFLWQRVDASTEVIEIDELPEKFDFGQLFALATSGIEINKKGLKAFYIPDERAPKFVWATNYATKGIGDSYERRQSIVPLYRAFNIDLKPVDVYGKLFFADWDESEWNGFYRFMLMCCQTYLKNGLVEWTSEVMRQKQMNCEVEDEYQSLFETLQTGTTPDDAPSHNRSDLLARYRAENPFPDSQLKTIGKQIREALAAWCKLRKLVLLEKKVMGTRKFQILEKVQKKSSKLGASPL